MSSPSDSRSQDVGNAPLNPALKQTRDSTYGPDQSGTDPMASVSVKKDEGTAWPMIWAVCTILGVIIAIALIVF
jgi:hypothetical protein